ncbi:MAG TPA: TetR/AcrR family transcriptional regulator, partial [Spongiibacteraceae bacterium]|nr:TetR/AcrR family transcriptional regulator [Spongiibacteraceae bacterium]
MTKIVSATPARRAPGRQATLSRQKIIAQALHLLEHIDTDELTMTRIAEGLGTTTMALYKYFANRDALLHALAEHTFSLLATPMPGEGEWQQRLLAWLRALHEHIEQYPTTLKVIGWEGRVSGAWVRVIAPVAQLLGELGFKNEQLAFILAWFTSSAMGFLRSETAETSRYRQRYSFGVLDGLTPSEQQTFTALLPLLPEIDHAKVMEFGLQQLVATLAGIVESKIMPAPVRAEAVVAK